MEASSPITAFLIIAAGLFTISGAVMDWDWFMNHSKARLIVWLFGRDGARFVYVLLGLFITLGGLMMIVMRGSG